MRVVVLVAVVFLFAPAASVGLLAQGSTPNHLYVEVLGNGGPWSINFERESGPVRLRAGYAGWSTSDLFGAGTSRFSTFPLTVSHVRGDGNHHLETGAGVTFGSESFSSAWGEGESSSFTTFTGILGYRYQKPHGGFVFRLLFTPMYGLGSAETAYPDRGFFPSVGLSVGRAF